VIFSKQPSLVCSSLHLGAAIFGFYCDPKQPRSEGAIGLKVYELTLVLIFQKLKGNEVVSGLFFAG